MTSFENVQFINSYTEDNFVGLKYKKDTINIYLPLGYEINRTSENNNFISEYNYLCSKGKILKK